MWKWTWPGSGRGDRQDLPAEMLYARAVELAREPRLFSDLGVSDTVDGRFDALALVVSVIMCRLGRHGERGMDMGRELLDVMFADMDLSLREMGAGDMGVPKRMKTMARAFAGRKAAYCKALEKRDRKALAAALERNLLRGESRAGKALVDFVLALDARIGTTGLEDMLRGRLA